MPEVLDGGGIRNDASNGDRQTGGGRSKVPKGSSGSRISNCYVSSELNRQEYELTHDTVNGVAALVV